MWRGVQPLELEQKSRKTVEKCSLKKSKEVQEVGAKPETWPLLPVHLPLPLPLPLPGPWTLPPQLH